jgi:hypothetical protein
MQETITGPAEALQQSPKKKKNPLNLKAGAKLRTHINAEILETLSNNGGNTSEGDTPEFDAREDDVIHEFLSHRGKRKTWKMKAFDETDVKKVSLPTAAEIAKAGARMTEAYKVPDPGLRKRVYDALLLSPDPLVHELLNRMLEESTPKQ